VIFPLQNKLFALIAVCDADRVEDTKKAVLEKAGITVFGTTDYNLKGIVMETKTIIEKWYRTLRFPPEYDGAFYEALDTVTISPDITPDAYDPDSDEGKRNLLTYLFFCEQVGKKAAERGIPGEVVVDTLRDIVIWTRNYTEWKGELYLGELNWLKLHIQFTIFRLGRLQFRMAGAETDIPTAGVAEGDPVLEIHVPGDGRLDIGDCLASLDKARAFFARYFPDHRYQVFTCHSWLLDDTLKAYLPKNSNILRFGNLFTKIRRDDSNVLLRYLFRIDTTEENLTDAVCRSAFAERIRDAVLAGKTFHPSLGYILR